LQNGEKLNVEYKDDVKVKEEKIIWKEISLVFYLKF
jgi:hypothetical protein